MTRENCKHIFIGLCIIFLFFLAITAVASATTAEDAKVAEIQNAIKKNSIDEKIATNMEFNASDLSSYTFENYDLVKLKGCQLKRSVGEPALPMKSIYLVIPPTAQITGISVVSSKDREIEGEYTILPAQPPVPTSSLTYQNETRFVAQKASVYSSSDSYPGDIVRYTGEGNLRGYKIVSLVLFPIQYVPVEKKLVFYTNITLCINYTATPEALDEDVTAASRNSRFTSIVKKTVSNPDSVDTYQNFVRSTGAHDDVKYVIITNDVMKEAFQPLADWKTKKGVPAKVVTVSSIEANYSGNDTQEEIRNFIKYAITTWNTEWILLGGDTDVVQHRGAYGNVSGEAALGDYWVDYNIPTDLYYSDLDGNWNADGDSIYGEVADYVNLYPDVFVGRAPVNTIAEAQTFVNKTLQYEKNPPIDYELDMLFLAEKLWDDPVTWGGAAKNIIDTVYIPPKYDPITKKYEMYDNISRQIAINEMNAGPHIVNHVGHGNTGCFCVGSGCIYRSDADGLYNSPKNFILYTISCYSNAFDSNSLSEHFMNNLNGGTVSYIGNSRYGFFIVGYPGEGPSDLYDQEFFNSLFADNLYHLGETVADSKVAYISLSQQDGNGMRWLQYAINLLGDPELPIWTETPQNFTIHKPSEITANITQEIIVQVLNGTEPVQNATVCIMKSDDDIYNVSATDSSGNVSFLVSLSVGVLNATVTKHNFIPNESLVLVVASSAPIISSSTHPDEDTRYCNRNATFNWTTPSDPSGIACYSYTLDNSSTTAPDETCDTTENTTSYTNLTSGTWYFHARAKNNDSQWGPAGHYRVMIENCSANDGWVNTSNTQWVNDTACTEKEQQEQEYYDYFCDNGNCSSIVTDTQWIDTGTTRNKPYGSDCGCTVNNTLKRCYGGTCSDTRICNSSICNADVYCDGKQPGEESGTDSNCDYTCKCQGPEAIFDTGKPLNPYPSISRTHNGTIKLNESVSVSKLYTLPCSGTGGHTEYARIWNLTLNATATWNGYDGDWNNISFNKTFTLFEGETYNYSIRTGSYPQIHHTPALLTSNGWINCTEFIDANGRVYYDWIPAFKLFI